MTQFQSRRHRLELPPTPNTDDPLVLKKSMEQMRRLVQDEFNRLATDLYDFKKVTYEAAVLPLKGVSNIAVTATQYGLTATWENPQQDTVEPTHVRIRVLEVSPNDFAEYSYPINSWEFDGLLPGTQYTLQIQLVARFETTDSFVSTSRNCPSVPVLRTAESDIKAKVFTTLAGVSPPQDNGTNDTNVIFNFPDTDGTPGTAGGTDCYWGYKFQYRTACAWADTAVAEVEVDGNIGDVTVDTGAVPFTTFPNSLFRMAYREICNSVAQDWVYGEAFAAVDFSNADCLGIVKSSSLTTAPFSTATGFALPGVCQVDNGFFEVVEELTENPFLRGTGLKCVEYIDSEWTLIGEDTTAIPGPNILPMVGGQIPKVAALGNGSDFTLSFDIKQPTAYNTAGAPATSYPLIEIGGKITVYFIGRATEFDILLQVARDGGGVYTFRAEDLAYGEWNKFYYVHDVSEADGRILYANSVEVARSANAVDNDFDDILGFARLNAIAGTEMRSLYMWESAVPAGDITFLSSQSRPFVSTSHSNPAPAFTAFDAVVGDLLVVSFASRDGGGVISGFAGTATVTKLTIASDPKVMLLNATPDVFGYIEAWEVTGAGTIGQPTTAESYMSGVVTLMSNADFGFGVNTAIGAITISPQESTTNPLTLTPDAAEIGGGRILWSYFASNLGGPAFAFGDVYGTTTTPDDFAAGVYADGPRDSGVAVYEARGYSVASGTIDTTDTFGGFGASHALMAIELRDLSAGSLYDGTAIPYTTRTDNRPPKRTTALDVALGDVICVTARRSNNGTATPSAPDSFLGTAAFGTAEEVIAFRYETIGASDYGMGIYLFTCTTAGTVYQPGYSGAPTEYVGAIINLGAGGGAALSTLYGAVGNTPANTDGGVDNKIDLTVPASTGSGTRVLYVYAGTATGPADDYGPGLYVFETTPAPIKQVTEISGPNGPNCVFMEAGYPGGSTATVRQTETGLAAYRALFSVELNF